MLRTLDSTPQYFGFFQGINEMRFYKKPPSVFCPKKHNKEGGFNLY
jgi:hypothetical protein